MKNCMAAAIALVILMISLSGCSLNSGSNAEQRIYQKYSEMKGFSAETEITVKSFGESFSYTAEQEYKDANSFSLTVVKPDSVSGCGYLVENGEINLFSGLGEEKRIEFFDDEMRSSVSLTDFFGRYYKNKDGSSIFKRDASSHRIVMETSIPEESDKRRFQRLYLDEKSFEPIMLELIDSEGNSIILVRFLKFEEY